MSKALPASSPAPRDDASRTTSSDATRLLPNCKVYVRRRCRCTHTQRQHRNGTGPCFAASNVCTCSSFVEIDRLNWCDTHHRPAKLCENQAREAYAASGYVAWRTRA